MLVFILGIMFGALWGLSRHEWLYCRVGAHLLLRMREAMKSLGIEEWKIDKAQEYIGSVVIPPYIPMPTPPTVKDDLMEAVEDYAATGESMEPAKWSKEDEKVIHLACEFIRHRMNEFGNDGSICGVDYKTLYEKLKSIRPQNRWKPTEKQMKALNKALYHVDYTIGDQIAMLIGDLKKL